MKSSGLNIIITMYAVITLMLMPTLLYSENDGGLNQIIISGQVTNLKYGNAVYGHPVYIKSELSLEERKGYTNMVLTDIDGYYYDTINTVKTKGSFFIYTNNQCGESVDTTIHFRFNERESNMVIADFSIYLPFKPDKLQARFKYIQKMTGDKNTYWFFDITNNKNIISWYWYFGDGTSSSLQNPQHKYTSSGLFRVSLTVTSIIDGAMVTSEISKQIYIPQIEYYHIGGHVFADNFPVDKGRAYLYLIDSANHYNAFDTVAFDTLGYYYFYQIPEANYIVKAEPLEESEQYGVLMPTYYGNSLFWEDADIIELKHTSWEYDIKLEKGSGPLGGLGGISGNIKYINDGRWISALNAKGINIYLMDEDDNVITCNYSGDLGDFMFDLIAINSYRLYPEVTGIKADQINVELTTDNPVVDDIEIHILPGSTSYVVPYEGDPNLDMVGLPYPNPVYGSFSISTKLLSGKDVSYEIYDSFGHLIKPKAVSLVSADRFTVDVSTLKHGMYFIHIATEYNNYNRSFVVSR